jgi:hypothetical protein
MSFYNFKMWLFRVSLPETIIEPGSPKDVLYTLLVRPPCNENVIYFTYLSGKTLFMIRTRNVQMGDVLGSVESVGVKPGHFVLLGKIYFFSRVCLSWKIILI